MSDRAAALKAMLETDPANTFVRYALAMEHSNAGRLEDAVAEFNAILAHNPSYGAAYYHGGQALEKLGRTADAASLYRAGIDATTKSGDAHTASELQAALSLIT
jgi:tetratricopeptide (TPR) repeat protein